MVFTVDGAGVTLTYAGAKANIEGLAVTKNITVKGAAADFDASALDALNITCANFYLQAGAQAEFGNRSEGDTKNLVVSGTIANPAGCTFDILAANTGAPGSVLAWVTCSKLTVGGTFRRHKVIVKTLDRVEGAVDVKFSRRNFACVDLGLCALVAAAEEHGDKRPDKSVAEERLGAFVSLAFINDLVRRVDAVPVFVCGIQTEPQLQSIHHLGEADVLEGVDLSAVVVRDLERRTACAEGLGRLHVADGEEVGRGSFVVGVALRLLDHKSALCGAVGTFFNDLERVDVGHDLEVEDGVEGLHALILIVEFVVIDVHVAAEVDVGRAEVFRLFNGFRRSDVLNNVVGEEAEIVKRNSKTDFGNLTLIHLIIVSVSI